MNGIYSRPWLLVDRRWKVISKYASREEAYTAATIYERGFRVTHIDDIDSARRADMRLDISDADRKKWKS